MIKGLIKFREHFAAYQDHYALIGGVASSLVLENAGLSFRQTKDFDVELFSRNPDFIQSAEGCHLTPIPIDEEISSLSAILLDVDYYGFLQQQTAVIDGVSVVTEIGLIPLKVKAWLDMSQRARDGEAIDSRKIRKHKNDVFRLFQIISPDVRILLPNSIVADMADFVVAVQEEPIDLKQLGLGGIKHADLIASFVRVYQIPGYDQLPLL